MPSILVTAADAECLNPEAQYVEDVITLMRRTLVDHHGFGRCVSNPLVSVTSPSLFPIYLLGPQRVACRIAI